MGNKLSVSGSTIMSDPESFERLFWDGIEYVEIGEFEHHEAFEQFLEFCQERSVRFGIHSPLLRSGSKYDLIEKVHYEPERAWENFEKEAKNLSRLGAEYILVHFPYFKGEIAEDPNEMIENGLKKLSRIQAQYDIPIVCEPKLGLDRSPAGIQYLHQFPEELWSKYGLKLCIDIGDYLIATGNDVMEYISKWKRHIKVAHIHNVVYMGEKYIWTPVHPSHEDNSEYYQIEPILRYLAEIGDIHLVFEHTPHTNPTDGFVREGYEWVERLATGETIRRR